MIFMLFDWQDDERGVLACVALLSRSESGLSALVREPKSLETISCSALVQVDPRNSATALEARL